MAETQYQVVRVSLTVLRTCLSVRFACSINYQLKYDSLISQSRTSYQLKSGSCQPHQKLSLEVEIESMGSEYCNSKAILIVGLISANGRVPAGSINIPIAQNGQLLEMDRQQTKTIDKCADKLAKVTYRVKIQYMRTVKKYKNQDQMARSIIKPKSVLNYSNSEYLNLKNLYASRKIPTAANSHVSKNKTMGEKQRYLQQRRNTTRTDQNKSVQKSEKCISEKDSSLVYQQQGVIQPQQSRVRVNTTIGYERQEPKYFNYQLQEKMAKYRLQTQQLMIELNTLREKNKNLQRKEKENMQQIRELREQIEKMKNRANLLEENNFQYKLTLEQKEKAVGRLNEELKILKEYIEEVRASSSMQEKKIDYKESVYSEQAKKMTEKYQQSELERQKIMMEMNNMLTQYEASQKKSLMVYKQKERAAIEEKNKLLKKIETLTQTIKRLQQENSDQQSQIQEQLRNNNNSNKNKIDLENDLNKAMINCQILEQSNKKLQLANTELKNKLNEVEKMAQDLKQYPKKHSQLQSQHTKLKQSHSALLTKLSTQSKTLKDLESTIKQLTTLKETTSTKISQLTKQSHISKKQLQSKQTEIQKLYESIAGLNRKNEELKDKYQGNLGAYQQKMRKLETEVVYLGKRNQGLEADYEQLKEKYEKSQENFQGMVAKVSELNNKILKLNQQLLIEQQKNKTNQSTTKQFQTTVQLLKSQLLSKQHKQKQLSYSLKQKNEQELEMTKTLRNKQKQLTVLKEKESQLILAQQQSRKKIQQLMGQVRELEKDGVVATRGFNQRIRDLEDQRCLKQSQYDRLKEEYDYLKTEKQDLEDRLRVMEIDVLNKNKTIREKEDQISAQTDAYKKISALLKKKQQQAISIKDQYKRYKSELIKTFQSFTIDFCRSMEQQSPGTPEREKNSLSEFAQEYYLIFQTKIMKTKRELITKSNQTIKNLEQSLQLSSNELQKILQNCKQSQKNYEQLLQQQKQKFNDLSSETSHQKNQLLQKISALEQANHDILAEKEKILYQLSCVNEEMAEYRKLVEDGQAVQDELERKVGAMAVDNRELEKVLEIMKKSGNSQLAAVNQEHRVILEKQKNNAKELEKKIAKLENELSQSQITIKDLQDSLSEKSYELKRALKNVESSQKVIEQLKQNVKSLKQQITANQQTIAQLIGKNEALSKQISGEKYRNQDLSLQLHKQTQSCSQLQKQSETLQNQLQKIQQSLQQSSEKHKKSLQCQQKAVQKSSSLIKQLKQKIISLNSELELKEFLIAQNQANHAQVRAQLQALGEECRRKKDEIFGLASLVDQLRSQNLVVLEERDGLQADKYELEREVKSMKNNIERLTVESKDANYLSTLLQSQKKQSQKLRQQLSTISSKLKSSVQQSSQTISQLKRECSLKLSREQQLRKKIRELEKELISKTHQISLQSEKKIQHLQEAQEEFVREIQQLEEEGDGLRAMYEALRVEFRREVGRLSEECAQLTGLITEKEQLLASKDDKIRQQQHKCKFLQIQLKNCLQAWQSQKKQLQIYKTNRLQTKANKIMQQVDTRSQVLLASLNQLSSNRNI